MDWLNSDPREHFNKRGNIVIFTPDYQPFIGNVETKHCWCIFLKNGPRDYISEDQAWPSHWRWIKAPF